MERVVITGLGVVSCVGIGVRGFWEALTNGRSGIARITAFDPSPYKTQIAGEVRDFSFDAKAAKRLARNAQFALVAADEAVAAAGVDTDSVSPERLGVCFGSGIAGLPFLMRQYDRFLRGNPGKVHPLTIPIIIPNMAAANIAIRHGFEGVNLSLSMACSTGNHAVGVALDALRAGRADIIVAGGTEAVVDPFPMEGFVQLRAMSRRNDDPEGASRPFCVDRDGFVIAEGAGAVVMERLSCARRRGADILAEVAGFGMSSDAHHLTAPCDDGRGAVLAMRNALRDAGLPLDRIDYINAHGTSTPLNDRAETFAIKKAFGDHARNLAVSSNKSMVGHGLGAASALEAVASVMTLRSGVLPPTINYHTPDPELDLDVVPNTAREADVSTVMSNSFAFGGHNGVIVFRRFDG